MNRASWLAVRGSRPELEAGSWKLEAFNYDIVNITAHRPWPMPSSPWVMTQIWHDLMMAGASGIPLPPIPPLLHFSKRQDMVGWMLQRV